MTTVGDIYGFINKIAPFHTAMDFDNPGLLVGDEKRPVRRALLSLDITSAVAEEAGDWNADLIVSHHPVIFHPLKRLRTGDVPYLLAQREISAICAHTNLDMAEGGVNTCLAARLGLGRTETLKEYGTSGLPEALLGELDREMSPEDFARWVKTSLACGGLKYVPGSRAVKRVALCSGAGGELLFDAIAAGADAFVTADTKHHELLAAGEAGITLVDAGHFSTEDVVILPLLERLKQRFPEVEFRKSQKMCDPARYL